jgi:SsrA-binding protein
MPILALNKRAKFDYELLDTFEGGLKLTGAEVKSAKAGHIQLKGAFLFIKNDELWLKNVFIAKYKPAGTQESYDPYRDRKVLVHKGELRRLIGKSRSEGLTIVPVSVYTRRNLVKLDFATARGKKQYEKRETIKKRDMDRQLRERMKE